jgi:hypothetical protein
VGFIVNFKGSVDFRVRVKIQIKGADRFLSDPKPNCFGIKTGSGKPGSGKTWHAYSDEKVANRDIRVRRANENGSWTMENHLARR